MRFSIYIYINFYVLVCMWAWVTDESHHLRSRWKLLRLTICACKATSFTSLNPPQYFMPGATICRRVLPQLSVSLLESGPLIKRLDIVTTHSVYSTSLSLSLSVSLLLLTLKSHPRWHLLRNAGTSVEEDGGGGEPIIHVPLVVGWQSSMPAAMLTCTVVAWHISP